MKKNHSDRILGRRLAREASRPELAAANGSATERAAGVSTWTTSYPADGPYNDSSGGGGTVLA